MDQLQRLSVTLPHKCTLIIITAAQFSAHQAADDVISTIEETCTSEESGFTAFWDYHTYRD
jgi:hypothetical protein